jgi:hypothetical protein
MRNGWRPSGATLSSLSGGFDTSRKLSARILGAPAPGKEGWMLTLEQKRGIRDVKGFTPRYQDDFDRRWEDVVERVRGSGYDIRKIVLSMALDGTRKH